MKFLLFFISCFSQLSSFSQSVKIDSVTDIQVKNAIDLYNHFTDGNAAIYNGAGYQYYTFVMEGDPYFETGILSNGWVSYSGRIYDSLSMMYDIERNEVVILAPDKLSNIVLQNELIDSFRLLGHTFISLKQDYKQNLYNSGFYDRLYNGKILFFARRIKTKDATIKHDILVRTFYDKTRYYIYKEGLYYLVSNKKDVFRLLGHKREIKRSLRQDHMKFRRKNFEQATARAAAFYDQLTR